MKTTLPKHFEFDGVYTKKNKKKKTNQKKQKKNKNNATTQKHGKKKNYTFWCGILKKLSYGGFKSFVIKLQCK